MSIDWPKVFEMIFFQQLILKNLVWKILRFAAMMNMYIMAAYK